jgi:sensor histidine kinase regulating citrate/malate metabolism
MEEKRKRMRLWEKIIIIIAIIALPAVAIHEFISCPYFKSELGNMACEMVSEQAEIIAVEDGIGFVFYLNPRRSKGAGSNKGADASKGDDFGISATQDAAN